MTNKEIMKSLKQSGMSYGLLYSKVQKQYASLLDVICDNGNYFDDKRKIIDDMFYLYRFTGIMPESESVQKLYRRLMRRLNIDDTDVKVMHSMREFTNIVPSDDIVQEAYVLRIYARDFHGMQKIRSASSLGPLPEIVQAGYSSYLSKGQIRSVRLLNDFTGIAPSKEAYSSFIQYLGGKEDE